MYPEHLEGSRQEPRYRVRLPRAEGGGRRLEAGRMHMYDWMYGTENGVQHDETSTYFRSIATIKVNVSFSTPHPDVSTTTTDHHPHISKLQANKSQHPASPFPP